MNHDPIIEELHNIRSQITTEHGHDLQRIGEHFMKSQQPPLKVQAAMPVPEEKQSGLVVNFNSHSTKSP